MGEKVKKILKKTIKFAVTACTILAGAILISALPFDEIKEKLQRKKQH